MSDLLTIGIILVIYLAVSIGIGIYGRSKESSAEDYFVASRKINPWVLFCTLAATNFSAFFFLGFAGASYRAGWGFYGIMAMGTSLVGLSILLLGVPIHKLGKEKGYVTPSELITGETNTIAQIWLFCDFGNQNGLSSQVFLFKFEVFQLVRLLCQKQVNLFLSTILLIQRLS